MEILLQNEVTSVQILTHTKPEDLAFEQGSTAGKKAIIREAIKRATSSRKESSASGSEHVGVSGSFINVVHSLHREFGSYRHR